MADFRSWLVLGRVSNLSTVWANGLCAWILGSGGSSKTLLGLLAGLSLLYVGGMYLNDYCDVEFDRPERPIPAGLIKRSTVLAATMGLLSIGFLALIRMDTRTWPYALLLVGLIVAYNLVHKLTTLGVALMAACRTSVYMVPAAATPLGLHSSVWWAGGLMFFYVLGVTILARTESTALKESAAGYVFLVMPFIGMLYLSGLAGHPVETLFPLSFCLAALWVAWTFFRARKSGRFIIGKTIGPLLWEILSRRIRSFNALVYSIEWLVFI